MPSVRKPNPKSQLEIQNNQIEPYIFPDTGESLGNPNIPTNFNQFTANDQSGIDFNRSEKMSFKDDTSLPFTVGLQDIDESIMYYFQNVIRPTVIQNGVRIPFLSFMVLLNVGNLYQKMDTTKIKMVLLCLL
jgi:hypothetical protein